MREPFLLLLLSGLALAEGPFTLEDYRRLARERSTGTRAARLELESATETRKAAFAKWFPQVSVMAGALASRDPLASATTSPMNLPVYDGNPANLAAANQFAYVPGLSLRTGRWADDVSVTAIQPVFVGGKVVKGNALAAVGEEVARGKLSLAERDAVAQAEDKYWTLLALQGKRRTLDAYDSMLARLSAQVGDAVAHGLTTRNDLLKVRLKQGYLRLGRLELESGLRLSSRDLRRHLGLEEDTSLALADTLPEPLDPTPLGDLRRGALDRRIEAKLLSQAVRAEYLQADIERAAALPSVLVGADASYGKIDGFEATRSLTVFGLVSVPLTDIWSGVHASRSHTALARVAEVQEADTRRGIELGVAKDWDDLVRRHQASLLADETVAQAEENLREESDRHRVGLSTISDLLEAQALLQQTLDQRIDARKDYWMARSAYLRACGR